MNKHFFGYGIVGKSGRPWWDETCVCQDRAPMQETVDGLNDKFWAAEPNEQPYRVVALFYETHAKAAKKGKRK